MHIVNVENNSDEGGISDKLVLSATILLILGVFVAFPISRAIAQTTQKNEELLVVVSVTDKDYTVLLSSLFGRVGREVPELAHTHVKNVDEYRFRIARSVKENDRLVAALYTRVDNLPKKLAKGYREEIDDIKSHILNLKIAVIPYVENDAFLSKTVVEYHNLYTSFVERLVDRINTGMSLENLNRIRTESYNIRKETALLYQKINMVMNG